MSTQSTIMPQPQADDDGGAKLVELLSKTTVKEINEVSFADRGLKLNTAEDVEEIVQAIDECKDMQSLRLAGNTIGVHAAEAIAKALQKKPEFERARWADMFTGRLRSEIPKALGHFGAAVRASGARLVELDLSDNAFGPDGVKAIQSLIESEACYSLKELRFNNNGLGIGGKILAESLIKCHKSSLAAARPLKLLVFVAGRNRLEDPGAVALGEAFKIIGTLEEIAMPQNGINEEGIAALAQSFTHNKNLRKINLQDNTFTEKGAIPMAKALRSLDKLESINFGDCLIRSKGAIALAKTIQRSLPNLREFNLSYGEIEKDAGIKLAESVETKAHLKVFDLNGNSFGEEGVELIRAVLEANQRIGALGSLSEDEGDDSDDEYEDVDSDDDDDGDYDDSDDDGDDSEEVCPGEDKQGTISKDPKLEVQGIKAVISPRRDNDKVNVVPATAGEFLNFPSADKLLGIGDDRGSLILKEIEGKADDTDKAVQVFVKVASVMDQTRAPVRQAVYDTTDVILERMFTCQTSTPESIANAILVHLGLIKSEDKIKPVKNPNGMLLALEHAVRQDYFPANLVDLFILFLSKANPTMDSCLQAKHELLKTLYKI